MPDWNPSYATMQCCALLRNALQWCTIWKKRHARLYNHLLRECTYRILLHCRMRNGKHAMMRLAMASRAMLCDAVHVYTIMKCRLMLGRAMLRIAMMIHLSPCMT
eukprot:4857337-Pyramimonas_sp.AAC.1